jgi:hypothetical protein
MEYQTIHIEHFNMQTHAVSIMLPNGEAIETSCEGWDHGERIAEEMKNLGMESSANGTDGQSEFQTDDGHESGKCWSVHSLLDSISNPDEPNGEPLRPSRGAINKLPQGFALPLGLKNIEEIYSYFHVKDGPPTNTSFLHDDQPFTNNTSGDSNVLKRKRSSRKPRHKVELSKLKDMEPEQFKAAKNALNKSKKLRKRHCKLPSENSPLLQKHASNINVVASSASGLNLEHSKPGWIGTQRVIPSQNTTSNSMQTHSTVEIDPRWNEEVKYHVKNGWQYIRNDVK